MKFYKERFTWDILFNRGHYASPIVITIYNLQNFLLLFMSLLIVKFVTKTHI